MDRKLSKTELCEKAGVTMPTLSKMKRGGEVRTDTLEKICSTLGVTFDQIMEIEPKDPGQSET